MTGVQRMAHDEGAEVLTLARGGRIAQAEGKTYEREVGDLKRTLGRA